MIHLYWAVVTRRRLLSVTVQLLHVEAVQLLHAEAVQLLLMLWHGRQALHHQGLRLPWADWAERIERVKCPRTWKIEFI